MSFRIWPLALCALLLAVPASAAAGPRALYVADGVAGGAGSLAQMSVGVPGGALRPLVPPAVETGGDPQHVAVTSDGRFAYASAAEPGLVFPYRVRSRGRLVPLAAGPVAAAAGAHGVVVTPRGDSVYVANQGPGTVSQYDVGRGGALTPKSPAAVPSGAGASGVAVSPDGRSVYVTNLEGASVSQFDVDRATGALTPKSPATVAAPAGASGLAVSPDGRSLYVASLAGRLAQFGIDRASGALTPKSPATVPAGLGAAGVAITPDGRFLYTPNALADSASQFAIDRRSGRLTPLAPAAVPAGDRPEGVAVTPNGRALYVANADDGTVSRFAIGRSGRLAPAGTAASGPSPHGLIVTPDQGPSARFRVRARTVRAGELVRFDAAGSRDPDGEIARYAWRFGDGRAVERRRRAVAHRYRRPGRYAVRLTVTDDERCSTRRIYTGQTTSCDGGRRARAVRRIRVLPGAP